MNDTTHQRPYDNIPFALEQPQHHVTNSEFLTALCPQPPAGSYLWTNSFAGDPDEVGAGRAWNGGPLALDVRTGVYHPEEDWRLNNYFAVSTFGPDANGYASRGRACVTSTYVLVIDDLGGGLGGKVDWEKLRGRLVPTYVIETSPGSFHAGYALRSPVADRDLMDSTIRAMVYQGLGLTDDPGMLSITRYVRLPAGLNGKAKYGSVADDGTVGFPCQLIHWAPERKYDLWEIAADFGLSVETYQQPGAGSGGRGIYNASVEADIWYPAVEATGLLKGVPTSKGIAGQEELWQDMTCPWVHDHTGGVDNGTAYSPTQQSFKCHHGHCQEKTFRDIKHWMLRGEAGMAAKNMAEAAYAQECFGTPDEVEAREQAWQLQMAARIAQHGQAAMGQATGGQPGTGEAGVAGAAGAAVGGVLGGDRWEPEPYQGLMDRVLDLGEHDLSEAGRQRLREFLRDVAAAHLDDAQLIPLLQAISERTQMDKLADLKRMHADAVKKLRREAEYEIAEAEAKRQGFLGLPRPQWRHTNPEGAPLCVPDNYERLLEAAGCSIWYNEMKLREEFGGAFRVSKVTRDLDSITTLLLGWSSVLGMTGATHNLVAKNLEFVARKNARHPFHGWLEHQRINVAWDGVDRLRAPGGLFNTIHVESGRTGYRNLLLQTWLYSVVAAARHLYEYKAGSQPRGVLIFLGQQYSGKTTWFSRLFEGLYPSSRECFADGMHFDGSTDSVMAVCGQLVTELGEIDSITSKTDAGKLKAFISSGEDRIRRPYARSHVDIPRRTVFAGTVNKTDFLRDDTGNTRYWTVPVSGIDLDAQRVLDMGQVWLQIDEECRRSVSELESQSVARGLGDEEYRAAPWLLTQSEMEQVNAVNTGHMASTDAQDWLMDMFDWDDLEYQAGNRDPVNAWKITELKDEYANGRGRVSQYQDKFRSALRRLTGQDDAHHRSVSLYDETGKPRKAPDGTMYPQTGGRFWLMPPRRDGRLAPRQLLRDEKIAPDGKPMH